MVRATAIASEPIASFRAVEVRGGETHTSGCAGAVTSVQRTVSVYRWLKGVEIQPVMWRLARGRPATRPRRRPFNYASRPTSHTLYIASRRVWVALALRSLASATISSWRTRSREMFSSLPTSSSVRLRPSPMP